MSDQLNSISKIIVRYEVDGEIKEQEANISIPTTQVIGLDQELNNAATHWQPIAPKREE